jgi:spermidine/putrescine-binding protein
MTATYLTKSGQMPAPKRNLADLTKDEIDQVVKFLKQKKSEGQFRAIWTDYGQIVNLMASEEAWISDGWNPAIEDAKRQSKLPLKYVNPKEGNRPWFHGTVMSKKGQNPEGVYAFANWTIDGWLGAQIAGLGWYSAAKTVEKFMKPEDYKFWYAGGGRDSGSFDERSANIAYWVSWPSEYDYFLSSWSSFLAS